MMKWEGYEEKYFFTLDMMWTVYDGVKAKGRPSKWYFTVEGLKGHEIALT